MSDKEPIVFKFTPHHEGDFIKGIPPRDLTQADVDRIHPNVWNDAFAVHPLYGKPLYTAVDGKEKATQERAIAAHDKAVNKEGDA